MTRPGRDGAMDALTSDIFLFEGFRLDRRGGGLIRRDDSGTFVPVGLSIGSNRAYGGVTGSKHTVPA